MFNNTLSAILLAASSDIDNDHFNIIEYYFKKIEDVYVDPVIFFEFTTVLIVAFLLRLIIFYRIESDKFKQVKKKFSTGNKLYLFGHIIFELFISYIVAYFMIKATNANPESYILNMIIGPAIGFMVGVWIDTKFIMPLNLVDQVDKAFHLYKEKKSSDNGGNTGNNVVFNFNGSTLTQDTPSGNKPKEQNPIIQHIDKSLAEDENFNEKIIDVINDIKDVQAQHTTELSKQSSQLESAIESLDVLKNDSMITKKAALKKMMYECLNQGYATPEQNDKIEMFYKSYRALDGNGEVEALYMLHYVKLPIHRDGVLPAPTTVCTVLEAEPKQVTGPIYYGMYDDERYVGEEE